LKKASAGGPLSYGALLKALHSIKDLDTGGLTAPLTIRNNRFPVGTVWTSNVEKGIFEPAPGWSGYYLK
jgi:hypothetical protein